MKNKGLRVSFAVKLLAMFLVVILIANISISVVSYKNAAKNITESVYEQLSSVATDLTNQIDSINKRHFQALHAIAKLATISDENVSLEIKQKEMLNVFSSLGENCIDLAFYDENGDALLADGRRINFATRPYFQEALAGKDFVSDPTFSTVTNSVLQHYSVPVYNENNRIIGAIVMVLTGNAILNTIEKIDMGGGMHPSVINRATASTVANANEDTDENASNGELDNSSGLGLVLTHIFEGKEGIEDFIDPNLNAHLIASYKKVQDTTWSVFAVAPYDAYFGALKHMQMTFLLVTIVVIMISALIVLLMVRLMIRPLNLVKNSVTTIASGNADLTQRIPETSNDEIGDVVVGFNGFVEKLQDIVTNLQNSKNNLMMVDSDLQASTQDTSASITQIISNIESVNNQILSQSGAVQETAGSVNEISSNIESLERMIESQAERVAQASSAVEQMIGNINSVNASVGKMIESFMQLQRHSSEGSATQNNANEKIMQIEEQSKMLQDANTAIANIASQTNLLAMNAAIEAAHAGEAGKGFAVVADEIRKLSETSTEQSKTIGAELKKIQVTIQDVVDVSGETNTAFASISQSIAETSQIIEQIRGAMEEQQIGSHQIIEALHSMNDSTSEVRSASEEMTEGNRHILAQVQKLQDSTETMKDSIQEMHVGAERINATGAALSDISGKMAENIHQIGEEIDLFKV